MENGQMIKDKIFSVGSDMIDLFYKVLKRHTVQGWITNPLHQGPLPSLA